MSTLKQGWQELPSPILLFILEGQDFFSSFQMLFCFIWLIFSPYHILKGFGNTKLILKSKTKNGVVIPSVFIIIQDGMF